MYELSANADINCYVVSRKGREPILIPDLLHDHDLLPMQCEDRAATRWYRYRNGMIASVDDNSQACCVMPDRWMAYADRRKTTERGEHIHFHFIDLQEKKTYGFTTIGTPLPSGRRLTTSHPRVSRLDEELNGWIQKFTADHDTLYRPGVDPYSLPERELPALSRTRG